MRVPQDAPGLPEIRAAARAIRGQADGTPLVPSALSDRIGQPLWLKLEICQPTGAFKLRGALNALAGLGPDVAGVTCCSTGNHGRAVAFAAQARGMRAVICMSELVPQVKVAGIRALGAEVRIIGRSQDEAQAESHRLAREEGLAEIPPFDHPAVIAGQGTIGLEIVEALPKLSLLLVPLSGGGLAAGMALAARALRPDLRIVGLTMDRGAAMAASIAAGRPVAVEEVASLADSLGGGIGAGNALTLPICAALLDAVVLLSEEEIYHAMQALCFEDRLLAEGASVVGIAGLLSGKVTATGPVATVLTGRNMDMAQVTRIMAGQDLDLGGYRVKGAPYTP